MTDLEGNDLEWTRQENAKRDKMDWDKERPKSDTKQIKKRDETKKKEINEKKSKNEFCKWVLQISR